MRVTIDFETANPECDVTKVGAAVYWAHPKTEVLCLCAITDVETEYTWRPGEDLYPFGEFASDPDVIFEAHGVQFEWYGWQWMVRHYGMPPIPIKRWDD